MSLSPLSLFNSQSNLRGLFNAKVINVEEQQWYYLILELVGDKGIYIFPQGISPKVNAIPQLGFEFVFNFAVQHVSHVPTRTHRVHLSKLYNMVMTSNPLDQVGG